MRTDGWAERNVVFVDRLNKQQTHEIRMFVSMSTHDKKNGIVSIVMQLSNSNSPYVYEVPICIHILFLRYYLVHERKNQDAHWCIM